MADVRTKELFYVAQERQAVYERRSAGKPRPWTDDPILQNWRFANVYREEDKTTQWIAKMWRQPHKKDPDVWFAMVVARQFNLPESLAIIGYPVPWNGLTVKERLQAQKEKGRPIFGSAYKVLGGMPGSMPTLTYVVDYVLTPLWRERTRVQKMLVANQNCLAAVFQDLVQYKGLRGFMAAQIIAELKYTSLLEGAQDWYTWAAPGPGSKRGLNRVLNRPFAANWRDDDWLKVLLEIYPKACIFAEKAKMPELHAQDFQGWLCEFDKYERVRLGEGSLRPFDGGKGFL